jgi:hypothetical protein
MKTFDEIYQEVYERPYIWNYYKDLFKYPFNGSTQQKNDVRGFIKKYIICSGKATLEGNSETATLKGKSKTELFQAIGKLGTLRLMHIVSTFFLGIHLYKESDTIESAIDKAISNFQLEHPVPFSYIWFLICLFHDLGYQYEEDKNLYEYRAFCKEHGLEQDFRLVAGVPEFYAGVVEPYFNYRIKKCKKNDHGICAARVFYKELCEIRKYQENKQKSDKIGRGQAKKGDPNLSWREELEKVYNYAAWVILAHNMWYEREDGKKAACYKEYGLEDLRLKPGEYKISLEEHPFLFLFCLVDTIEPIKCAESVTCPESKKCSKLAKYVKLRLSQISLKIDESGKTDKIILIQSDSCDDELIYNKLASKAMDLTGWLTKAQKGAYNTCEDTIRIAGRLRIDQERECKAVIIDLKPQENP